MALPIVEYSSFVVNPDVETRRIALDSFTPHPNVALFRLKLGKHNSIDQCENKTLYDRIKDTESGKCLSNEYRMGVLLQITHGLWHIHRKKIAHGYLTPKNIYFFSNGERAVIADFITEDGTQKINEGNIKMIKRRDIHSLGKIFYFVLSNGGILDNSYNMEKILCQDPEIAKDLILRMLKPAKSDKWPYFCPEEILRHPFFWNNDTKINLLVRSRHTLDKSAFEQYLNTMRINRGNWKDNLALQTHEIENSGNVETNLLVNIATFGYRDIYYDLLVFIRDKKIHFKDLDPYVIKHYFQDDETGGYWKFFSRRYPHLLMDVYKYHHSAGTLDRGLKQVFRSQCQNISQLPNKREIEVERMRNMYFGQSQQQ